MSCCKDVHELLMPGDPGAGQEWDTDIVELWDRTGNVAGGVAYDDEEVPW
ncbi:hypothetical protein ACWIGI_39420 [Nocardia sp. NPDC055321]